MKTRTLLIDGNYLVKRSFHGDKTSHNKNGQHIGAIYSFYTTLRKLIKENLSTKVVLMWDGEQGGLARYKIDPAYKANRKNKDWKHNIELSDAEIKLELKKEQSFLYQKKRIQAYAEELFIRQIEINEIEADDLIAEYCLRHSENEDIVLFTNDRDFLQLLDLNIIIKFDNIDIPITKSNFFREFNYHYKNALLMKIISGDTADNIAGVGGLKEDSLLKYFPELKFKSHTVREICHMAIKINEDRLSKKLKPLKCLENLINNVERLKINFQLVNLRAPLLNEQALEELDQLEMPLSPTNRGSSNLLKLMDYDGFLSSYNGTAVNYLEPFYTVIMGEKELLLEYKKNKRK